jgi:hypothetical protein
MTETNDRSVAVLSAFVEACGNRNVRSEPLAVFQALRQRIPDLEAGEIAVAADVGRQISSEMRATAHRLIQELVSVERKNAAR